MSRVGKQPIAVPSGVTITLDPDTIKVAGSKGELSTPQLDGITVKQEDGNRDRYSCKRRAKEPCQARSDALTD